MKVVMFQLNSSTFLQRSARKLGTLCRNMPEPTMNIFLMGLV